MNNPEKINREYWEARARKEFQQMTKFGFIVRRHGEVLNAENFGVSCMLRQEIWLWKPGLASDTIDPGSESNFIIDPEDIDTDWRTAYDDVVNNTDRVPYLPGEILDEDEYVELALEFGAVDLQRTRDNGQVLRTYGTVIGSS